MELQVAKWRRDHWSHSGVLKVLELALLATVTSGLQLWLPAFGTCKPCIMADRLPHAPQPPRIRDSHPLRLPNLPLFRGGIPDALRGVPDGLSAISDLHTDPFPLADPDFTAAEEAAAGTPAAAGAPGGQVERYGCAERLHRPLYIKYFGCPESHYNDLAVLLFSDNNQVIAANIEITHVGAFTVSTMAIYTMFVFVFAALSYGSAIPSGIFTPNLLVGSALGCAPHHPLALMSPVPSRLSPSARCDRRREVLAAGTLEPVC